MTTPLNKLADEWREEASQYDPESVHIRATLLQAADELDAALTAHNQRWLDLADELDSTLPEITTNYLSGVVDERIRCVKRIRQILEQENERANR